MRISDWSSDVCSSDLVLRPLARHGLAGDQEVDVLRDVRRMVSDALDALCDEKVMGAGGAQVGPVHHRLEDGGEDLGMTGVDLLVAYPGGKGAFGVSFGIASHQPERECVRTRVCQYVYN